MKRNLIYVLMTCFIIVFTSCEDNIEDATSKHVYAPDENPYLRTDPEATITTNLEFAAGHIEPQTINLADYADKFLEKMNMSLDQVISGLADGSIVFYNVSVSATWSSWDKTPMTKGTTGWYYNTAGGISTTAQTASIDIDKTAKTFIVNMNENVSAGTELYFNVGFAVAGPDYDTYLRFAFNLSVIDPTVVITSISIPDGDYSSFGIDFNTYAETINTIFGLSVEDFLNNLDANGGTIRMYAIDITDPDNIVWDVTSDYTATPPGYWLDDVGAVTNWNPELVGFNIYAETNTVDQMLYIGRAPGLTAGSSYKISVGYRDTTNENNYFRFIITATLE
ncbi:DUF4859 domain-containing protein [Saccharicrinis sp. FJH2]|uniref:DUF4859 domain-containing protein n=1 Tax=Saccharicrinis sp. FJH65 TaxID=3344659 RepID=UPI0035F24FC7